MKKEINRVYIPKIACPEVREEVITAMSAFSGKLRGLREAQGLSLQDAADDMGMKKQSLHQYEMNIHVPDAGRLLAIACYYGVSLDWLFGREF